MMDNSRKMEDQLEISPRAAARSEREIWGAAREVGTYYSYSGLSRIWSMGPPVVSSDTKRCVCVCVRRNIERTDIPILFLRDKALYLFSSPLLFVLPAHVTVEKST